MIPIAQITQWRQFAPWSDDMQIEQDLILSRIIVEIFSDPFLNEELAFRGGTALHKLFFNPGMRYSEDIDLVRTGNGAIKKIIDSLRNSLDTWLGEPKTERNDTSFKLRYFFNPETSSSSRLRIKIEINVRENFSVFDYYMKEFSMQSSWFSGKAQVRTYQFEELIATKLRALYQRKKGRDLFDIWLALKQKELDISKIIQAFQYYMKQENNPITRLLFEKNIQKKLQENLFLNDIEPLLSFYLKKEGSSTFEKNHQNPTRKKWNLVEAAEEIKSKILNKLPT